MRTTSNPTRVPRGAAVSACIVQEQSQLDQAITTYHDLIAAADDGMCGDIDFDIEAAHKKLNDIKSRIAQMRVRLN
jgi:hypothetical protein